MSAAKRALRHMKRKKGWKTLSGEGRWEGTGLAAGHLEVLIRRVFTRDYLMIA